MMRLIILLTIVESFIFKHSTKKYNLYSSKYNENIDKYNKNVNECIYNIKNEIQYFPYKNINYDIYDFNIIFLDPSGYKSESLEAYKSFMYMVKLVCRTLVKSIKFDYKLIHNNNVIILKWNSTWNVWSPSNTLYYNAVSYFHLNEEGKVKTHEIQCINIAKTEDLFNLFHNQKTNFHSL